MKILNASFLIIAFLAVLFFQKAGTVLAGDELREVIVSHTDEKGVLQLYRMNEDGTNSRQITHSKNGCRMPSCSPDRKKVAYVEQIGHGLALRVSDLNGDDIKTLIGEGMNLMPSWIPDSEHLVWMKVKPQPKQQDPARNAQIHIMNIKTGQSRKLFTDKEQLKHSNAMPAISPKGDQIAFVSNRSGGMRVWVSDLDGANAKLISMPDIEYDKAIKAPIEQKVPAWSPDGKRIAHWEGVETVSYTHLTLPTKA